MRLAELHIERYRSVRDETIRLGPLNIFIGPNASGKSTILDAPRLLAEAVQWKDFERPVTRRGGIVHLAWKGEDAAFIVLRTIFEEGSTRFEWQVRFNRAGAEFVVHERLTESQNGGPPTVYLDVQEGRGWWWSPAAKKKLDLSERPTACAVAAVVDASFPGRSVADFVSSFGFYDPSPELLRRACWPDQGDRLDAAGANLAARLFKLQQTDPETFRFVVQATKSVLGLPKDLEVRESEVDRRLYFVQSEPGLAYRVHQIGASSGTLRMLALMTALFGQPGASLVGIEEPENHVHPSALRDFVEYMKEASKKLQILITTHSPLVLDYLDSPESICAVTRQDGATRVWCEECPEAVRDAMEASGFSLGEFWTTKGFGG